MAENIYAQSLAEFTSNPFTVASFYVATFGSISLLIWGFYSLNAEIKERGKEGGSEETPDSALFLLMAPYMRVFGSIVVAFFALFRPRGDQRHFGSYIYDAYEKLDAKIKDDLLHAGKSEKLTTREIWGACVLASIGGAGLGSLFIMNFPSMVYMLVLPVLMGPVLPFLWLSEQAIRRQKEIGRSLPFAIDLLALMMRTGLDFTVGLERMVKELPPGALTEEFGIVCRELRMGNTREEVLRQLAHRSGVASVGIFTSAVIHSDRMGGEITSVLDVQAKSLRVKRFQTAEAEAAKAPVKMLFPLLLFIFPCVFIVLFGPILIKHKLQAQ